MSRQFFFDLGNVLVDLDLCRLFRAVAECSGNPVETAAPGLQDGDMLLAVETGKISDQQFLDYVNRTKGTGWTLEEWIAVWQDVFSINEEGFALFNELKSRGWPVHFLSNISRHAMEAVRRNWPDFFDRSDESFFSYELGLHKPDERIYRAAIARLHVDPDECFFLDDRPENVAGARAAGMNAHLFRAENMPVIREAIDVFIAEE